MDLGKRNRTGTPHSPLAVKRRRLRYALPLRRVHAWSLRIFPHGDVEDHDEAREAWRDFGTMLRNGRGPAASAFYEDCARNCQLIPNQALPLLNRSEGGLGGNSNQHNRQMRARKRYCSHPFFARECLLCHDGIYFDFQDPDLPEEKPEFSSEVQSVLPHDLGHDLNALVRDYVHAELGPWTLSEIRDVGSALMRTTQDWLRGRCEEESGEFICLELVASVAELDSDTE